ncbi:putative S-adenosylmethionine-dependent methyltransferase [Tetrabaena socialis]|uniref:Putative S-adenosylmethionine-dependent methyltransferase n=1 Tax=Tetrabaena socialis TaxID=47790 RepID=A0A2J7ZPC6_9CHLO|nr:putative S-adenosylmethionine-dependent methyltransferase [Tetrabaena socialis]|eukprot:PNH02123.1 putative S-adenosylmethionine-dependent methyltransferase [Tetrabaena socialis]
MSDHITLSKRAIDQCSLEGLLQFVSWSESARFFDEPAGREHYRLLAFLASRLPAGSRIIDTGGSQSFNSIALTYNPSVHVHVLTKELKTRPPNLHIISNDFGSLADFSLMVLDLDGHDGIEERRVLDAACRAGFCGVVLVHGIRLSQGMHSFWEGIPTSSWSKMDVTRCGHWSGTGLLIQKSSPLSFSFSVDDGYAEKEYAEKEYAEKEYAEKEYAEKEYAEKENYVTVAPSPEAWKQHPNYFIMRHYANYIRGASYDIGCNHGACTLLLEEFPEVTRIVGIDLNAEALAVARDIRGDPSSHRVPIEFIQANIMTLPMQDATADFVMSLHTLEHIYPHDAAVVVAEIFRVLKPGAHFLISIPHDHAFPDPCHVAFYKVPSLTTLMKGAGFQVIECLHDMRWHEKDLLTGVFRKPVAPKIL